MSDLTIRLMTMAEFEAAAGLDALLAEYASEAAIHEIGPPNPQYPMYRAMEAAGMLKPFGAFVDGQLVGFIFVMTTQLPHFGKLVSAVESYFVASAHRHTGAGNQLRGCAEMTALSNASVGILMSVPVDGRLGIVLPRYGYRETNTTFYKAFK